MHKSLTLLLMAGALSYGMVAGIGRPYDLAAEQMAINRTTAHEVLKQAASHDVMMAALDTAPLPPDMKLVLPKGDNEDPVVLLSRWV